MTIICASFASLPPPPCSTSPTAVRAGMKAKMTSALCAASAMTP